MLYLASLLLSGFRSVHSRLHSFKLPQWLHPDIPVRSTTATVSHPSGYQWSRFRCRYVEVYWSIWVKAVCMQLLDTFFCSTWWRRNVPMKFQDDFILLFTYCFFIEDGLLLIEKIKNFEPGCFFLFFFFNTVQLDDAEVCIVGTQRNSNKNLKLKNFLMTPKRLYRIYRVVITIKIMKKNGCVLRHT